MRLAIEEIAKLELFLQDNQITQVNELHRQIGGDLKDGEECNLSFKKALINCDFVMVDDCKCEDPICFYIPRKER